MACERKIGMVPKVSVIIPTHNRVNLLKQTLRSIFSQTLRPFEVIVVDDHSSDGTYGFVKDNFKDAIIVNNTGRGPGAARNVGFSISNGDYIKFFDSDDVMTRDTLQLQSQALHTSGAEFVYSPYFFATATQGRWTPTDNVILSFNPVRDAPFWHYMAIDGLFIPVPAMLFKKDFLERVGPWREDVIAYEDWDYLFRISLLEENPKHLNECAFI